MHSRSQAWVKVEGCVVLGLDSQNKNQSNLYDLDQIRDNVNSRFLLRSNTCEVSNEQGLRHHQLDVVKN